MGFFKEYLLDPTVLFITGILIVPLTKTDSNAERLAYLTDPTLLFCTSLMAIGAFIVRKDPKLSLRDRRVARWYLANGAIIHIMMDGLVGVFHKVKLMRIEYERLDARFPVDHHTVCVVGLIEMFCMAPGCFLVFYGYYKRASWRAPLEIATCTLQIAGTFFFVFTEAWDGMPAIPVDWKLTFTPEFLLYFWFAFVFCNILWVLLPLRLGYTAFEQISNAMKKKN